MSQLERMQYIANGVASGYQRGQQNKLAQIASEAYGAPQAQQQALVREAMATDPQFGNNLNNTLEGQNDKLAQSAANAARYLIQAYESKNQVAVQGAYAATRPLWEQFARMKGADRPIPEQFDEAMMPFMHEIVAAAGGGMAQDADEQFTLAPGSARYDASGRVIASQPFQDKPDRWDFVQVPDGNGGTVGMERNALTGEWRQPTYGRSPQASAQGQRGGAETLESAYQDAIAGIESAGSGDYSALGPVIQKNGDRAYGRYQVMGRNVPEWTMAALGRAMTPEEFLASPEAQDAVFNHRFGGYIKKYGAEGAARAWFAGEGGMSNAGARDSLGTSVAQYGRKFSQNLGGRLGYAPPKKSSDGAPSGYQWDASGTKLVAIPGGPADRKANPVPADMARNEMSMRKELEAENKQDNVVVAQYRNLQSAASNPSAANDLAMIFSYMKMLDPGSVVREQEFANAQNAAGVPDQVRNAWNKALSGERLNQAQRRQFISSAKQMHDNAASRIHERTSTKADIARQYGYDPVRSTGSRGYSDAGVAKQKEGLALLQEARAAIERGADKAKVRQRLIERGFSNLAGRL